MGSIFAFPQARRRSRIWDTVFFLLLGILFLLCHVNYCYSTVIQEETSQEPEWDIRVQCHSECSDTLLTQRNDYVNFYCNDSCKVEKCMEGCDMWTEALYNNCQDLCNGTMRHVPDKALYCMMGCHFALNVYVNNFKDATGVPASPVLVAGSQRNDSVILRWQGSSKPNITYLVQWKYEALPGDWEYFQPMSPLRKTECQVKNLHPYTKYIFRIAWIILPQYDPLISKESVAISTSPYGVPRSSPTVSLSVIDPTRILVSWDPPFFSNGPVLSYAVSLKDLSTGHSLVKDISSQNAERFYLFNTLKPSTSYTVSVLARNHVGEGPSQAKNIKTPARVQAFKNDSKSYLILGAKHQVIQEGIDLLDKPEIIFQSENSSELIKGVSLHIRNKMVFVSNSLGYIYAIHLEGTDNTTLLLKPYTYNQTPGILSVDWLHHKLYIVDKNRIARCNLDGSDYENMIVSLPSEPTEMKVDPYNGFLFWVLTIKEVGYLYKVDLIDLKLNPLTLDDAHVIFHGERLMAFAIDHSSLQLLLPDEIQKTAISISLDGAEVTDIHKNTQKLRFSGVRSFVVHHGLLYWTTGQDVMKEEYDLATNKYYHNCYTISTSQKPFVGLNILDLDAQPFPVPLNPVRNLEAVFDTHRCKISWTIPKLLRGIGTGAWQKWQYELHVYDQSSLQTLTFTNITSTSFTADNLQENTTLCIKVRAYSDGGIGPWSDEFKGRTIRKDGQERHPYILWSGQNGILKSNMLSTEVEPFIHKRILHRLQIVDISWQGELFFFNTNLTHILVYNTTSKLAPKRIFSISSAHSIAIDYFARKIYWSNPYQQVISRANFDGSQQEPLPIPTVAKELNVDSANAFLYWTTMYSVECARLNGEQRQVYFQAGFFAGKQVLGLTVDKDHNHVYWMVRSQEGAQLFRASTATNPDTKLTETVQAITILHEDIIRGPLRYYSDRLFWLHDQREAFITDLNGLNLATLKGPGLSNLKTLTIVDQHMYKYPGNLTNETLNVRPHQVVKSSIVVDGTWESFNITWQRSTNVNYGEVFYEIKIESDYDRSSLITEDNFFPSSAMQQIPPYTNITIALRVFTYWSSSRTVVKVVHSPMSVPSEPRDLRIFVTHEKDGFMSPEKNIISHLRWSAPSISNGDVIGYHVGCWSIPFTITSCNSTILHPTKLEYVINNLQFNLTYYFQVFAFTEIGMGHGSNIIELKTSEENPVPLLLVTKLGAVEVADMDTEEEQLITFYTVDPVDIAYLSHEDLIFWIDKKQGLMQSNIDGSNKIQISALGLSATSVAVDWVGRFLYWAETEEESLRSTIWKMDLNYQSFPNKLIQSEGRIGTLRINPFLSLLIWTEEANNGTNIIMTASTDGRNIQALFTELAFESQREKRSENITNRNFCSCSKDIRVGKPFAIDTSNSKLQQIFWVDYDNGHIWASDMTGCQCNVVVNSSLDLNNGLPPTSLTVDKTRIYWSNASMQRVYSVNKNKANDVLTQNTKSNFIVSQMVEGVNVISAIGKILQPLPDFYCLVPSTYIPHPTLQEGSESSLKIQLTSVHFPDLCKQLSKPSVYYLVFYQLFEEGNYSDCNFNISKCQYQKSYDSVTTISNLLPYKQYAVQFAVGSYYSVTQPTLSSQVIFRTDEGAPSEPTNVDIKIVSPEDVLVSWTPPEHLNGPFVHYSLYWEALFEGIEHQQQGQQKIDPKEISTNQLRAVLHNLLPTRSYNIMVRAYSSKQSFYSESKSVTANMFPLPGNLSQIEVTSSSLVLTRFLDDDNGIIDDQLICRVTTNDLTISSEKMIYNDTFYVYMLNNLISKTKYDCYIVATYCMDLDYCNYTWPRGKGFIFETQGDRPGIPGTPFVRYLKKDTFQVSWNPSEHNGGKILTYILQARAVYSSSQNEPDWRIVYNGSHSNWLISGLNLNSEYYFRVMCINEFGASNYSELSNTLNFSQIGYNEEDISIILGASIFLIAVLVITTLCIVHKVCKQRKKEKLILQDAIQTSGNPNLELATLQELPRNGNFRHQTNMLYSIGSNLLDEELAALPHISRDQIILTNFLGSGAFGEVFEGFARDMNNSIDGDLKVAIKTLRKGATDHEKGEFLKEAQLMSNFKHEHILSLLGVCLDNDPNFIILELMEGGDLLSYLRSNRSTVLDSCPLNVQDLISICVDVSKGCKYLEEMHFVHRDLAARNCLVSSRNPTLRVVKIGDFGLARDIYKNDYYRKEGEGLLPVRWMSPESLMDGVFTTQSDVWAFGILLWEVMTLGQQPYPARSNLEVLHYVRAGGRLDKPDNCPDDLHQLMLLCWNYNPDYRPTFTYCLDQLQELKRKSADLPNCVHNNHYIGRTSDGICNDGFSEEDTISETGLSPSSCVALAKEPGVSYNGVRCNNDFTQNQITQSENDEPKRSLFLDSKVFGLRDANEKSLNQDIPKYLELLCDEPSFSSLNSDGYEIPILSGCDKNIALIKSIDTPNISEIILDEKHNLFRGTSEQEPITDEHKVLALNGKVSSASPRQRPSSCPPQSETDASLPTKKGHSFSSCRYPNSNCDVSEIPKLPKTSWC